MLYGDLNGKKVQKRGDVCIGVADSLCCMVEINTGEGNGTPLQYSCLENPMEGLSDFTFTFHFHALEKEMATHSSVLAWRIQGQRSLVGCRLWGRTESDTTEVT